MGHARRAARETLAGHYYTCRASTTLANGGAAAGVPGLLFPLSARYSVGRTSRPERKLTVGYLAGLIAIAFVVFGWPYWPVGWVLIAALLISDFVLET